MAKTFNKTQSVKQEARNGYFMHSDGVSYWGVGLYKNSERPIECSKEVHGKTLAEKLEWYETQTKAQKV